MLSARRCSRHRLTFFLVQACIFLLLCIRNANFTLLSSLTDDYSVENFYFNRSGLSFSNFSLSELELRLNALSCAGGSSSISLNALCSAILDMYCFKVMLRWCAGVAIFYRAFFDLWDNS